MKKLLLFMLLLSTTCSFAQTVNDTCIGHKWVTRKDSVRIDTSFYRTKLTSVDSSWKYFCGVDTSMHKGPIRRVYVTGMAAISKSPSKIKTMIDELVLDGFTYVAGYGLDNSTQLGPMFVQMRRAGINKISGTFSGIGEVNGFISWDAVHPDSMDYNAVLPEIEAYNQADIAKAFKDECLLFADVDKKIVSAGISEMGNYLGWIKPPMVVDSFVVRCDWTNLHDYQKAPSFSYTEQRCDLFNAASARKHLMFNIVPLFSFETAFMQAWLKSGHTIDEAYAIWKKGFDAKHYTNLTSDGYMVFTLDLLRISKPANIFAKAFRIIKQVTLDPDFKNVTLESHLKMALEIDSVLIKQ